MEIVINQTNLRSLLIEQIPEAKKEFRVLPGEASVYTTLHKLYEVTSILAHQNQFRAVKRCLLVADDLLLHAEPAIKNAVSNVFLVYLGRLLDKKDSRAEVLKYLLPGALRAEYRRQLTNCLP